MHGLRAFLAAGHGDEAERLGWPKDELYAVPPLWSRVDLCGAALLIGDREVVGITPNEIRIKTASGATLAFYRKPAGRLRRRLPCAHQDGSATTPARKSFSCARSKPWSTSTAVIIPDADVDTAKAAVLAAIKEAAP